MFIFCPLLLLCPVPYGVLHLKCKILRFVSVRSAICRHDVNDVDKRKLTTRINQLLSVFNSHQNCQIPHAIGYTISEVHYSIRFDASRVEKPTIPGTSRQVVHCLRHAETGFSEKFIMSGPDRDETAVFTLLQNRLDNMGTLLCCDENYTNLELLSECSDRNIPFIGSILREKVPELYDNEKPADCSYRVFSGNSSCGMEFWLWLCWDHADYEPIMLISNFHMGILDKEEACPILNLYYRYVYGSAEFNRIKDTFDYSKINWDLLNTVFYNITNAMLINSKILYELDSEECSSNFFDYFIQLLISYSKESGKYRTAPTSIVLSGKIRRTEGKKERHGLRPSQSSTWTKFVKRFGLRIWTVTHFLS